MKKIFSTFIVILVLVVSFSLTLNLNAATGDVYNVVTCPGEDMATQIQINWQSPTSVSGLKVEYTEATDSEFKNAKTIDGVSREFSKPTKDQATGAEYVGFSTPRKVWTATLTDLTPKTKYIYRISNGTKSFTDSYAFETASSTDDEFSFLFMTDPQYYNETGASKFNILTETHIQNHDIKFGFITGDISDKGGNSGYWDMFFNKSSVKKIPFATTVGNHEYYDNGTVTTDNSIYNHFFNNPQNGPENVKGSSYYFVYNNALFIMIDSEDKKNTDQQKEWFRNVCNTVSCSYIIVGTHKSSYAGTNYYQDGKNFIAKWGSIFDECQVDLVLSGHDHMYARTKSLIASEETKEKYKGTTYILGGAAGDKLYTSLGSKENVELWAYYDLSKKCATVITLGKESMKVEAYEIGSVNGTTYTPGKKFDSCTLLRKRFGTVDPTFTKDEFEKSFTVENAMPDMTSGKVSWSDKGYGYVQSIKFTNVTSGEYLGSSSFINNSTTYLDVQGKFWIGEVNKIKVEILYKDGNKKELELELDNIVDWGTILSVEATEITTTTFNVLLKLALNKDVKYIDRIRVLENGKIKKNYFLKNTDLEKTELLIPVTNVLKAEEKHTVVIEAMNVNGTVIWSHILEVKGARDLSDEEIYQNDMANLAFQIMIENLLKALGQE